MPLVPKELSISGKANNSLQVEGLSKSFQGSIEPVFEHVSFNVPSGQSVALIGANGAGKSTLLRCCVRLIEPDSGHITLDGISLSGSSNKELRKARRHCGFVFQKHCLVPRLSVLSNVLHGNLAHHHGPRNWFQSLASKVDRERAMDCLDEVAIARALMQSPRILFADEPTASLDPQSGEDVMELFSRLGRVHGLTLFFVSHHIQHALSYADRILGLSEQQLLLDTLSHRETAASLRDFYV
jgi:phosphonate transport system ATP-binding protein